MNDTQIVNTPDLDSEKIENGELEIKAKEGPMAELLNQTPKAPSPDDVVEGPIIAIGRARVFVDLHPYGTGIIYGREYLSARGTLQNVHIRGLILAQRIGIEDTEG